MSEQTTVSSATTGVASQPEGHPSQQTHNLNYQHIQQQVNPKSHGSPTYFYPSSHIHNQPTHTPNPLSQHLTNLYTSSPPEAATPQSPPSLTQVLLSSSPHQFSLATQHPFLRLAGQGHLPKESLSLWLSQDRLYAQSYLVFIGSLIARVDLPYVNVTDKSSSLRWRLVQCLTGALHNIHTELKLFQDTADKYGLNLEMASRADGAFAAEPSTKQYIDLFRAFWTDPSMSLLEGMVVLWATETVYSSAWGYAKSFIDQSERETEDQQRKSKATSGGIMPDLEGSEVNTVLSGTTGDAAGSNTDNAQTQDHTDNQNSHSSDLDGGALRDALIPNWTSREFEGFVTEIAELTDLLAEREEAVSRKLDVYKAVWRYILDIERRFWPDVGVSD